MAGIQDVDPDVLAAIRKQINPLGASNGTLPAKFEAPPELRHQYVAPQKAPETVNMGPYSMPAPGGQNVAPTGQGGVPSGAQSGGGPSAAGPVQGDFVAQPGAPGTPGGPQWKMPGMTAVGARATSNVSPGVRKELDAAEAARAGVPMQEAAAQTGAAEQQAATLDQQQAALGKQMLEGQNAQRRRTEALDAQMNDYKRLQDEASAQKEDPHRWWGSKNGAEKALGVVGILLGGFAAGQTGRNPGLDAMNSMINRDIDAQKSEIAGKQKRADAAQNMYAQKLRQYGDENAADMATRAQMLEQMKLQTQAVALRSGSPIQEAKAKEVAAAIQLEQAKMHQGLETWHQSGVAGGLTPEDQKRAFELYQKGGVTTDQALQAALALRGVAPSGGLPTFNRAGGKGGAEDAAAQLAASGANPPAAMSFGERVQAALSHAPLIGPAFQGTSGERKELAQQAGNFPALAYAHKVAGARTPEGQEHVAKAFIVQPTDNQDRINRKYKLRALVKAGVMGSDEAAQQLDREDNEEGAPE